VAAAEFFSEELREGIVDYKGLSRQGDEGGRAWEGVREMKKEGKLKRKVRAGFFFQIYTCGVNAKFDAVDAFVEFLDGRHEFAQTFRKRKSGISNERVSEHFDISTLKKYENPFNFF
jgi:hypothetical protein